MTDIQPRASRLGEILQGEDGEYLIALPLLGQSIDDEAVHGAMMISNMHRPDMRDEEFRDVYRHYVRIVYYNTHGDHIPNKLYGLEDTP